jgi:hypothetical protein
MHQTMHQESGKSRRAKAGVQQSIGQAKCKLAPGHLPLQLAAGTQFDSKPLERPLHCCFHRGPPVINVVHMSV